MAPICTVFTRNTPDEAWAQCPGPAWSTVSGREAKIARKYWAKTKPQHKGAEYSFIAGDDRKIWCCAQCAARVVFACAEAKIKGSTSKRAMAPKTFVNDLLGESRGRRHAFSG